MAGFQRRNDALGAAEVVKGRQSLGVGDAHIFGAADVVQKRVLRAHAGIVQAGADAVRLRHLAVVVLQNIGPVAMQHTGAAALYGCRMLAALQSRAGCFHPDQAGVGVGDIGVKNPHGVAAAAHAGHHRVGLFVRGLHLRQHGRHLFYAFLADHALEVAHHHGVRVGAGHGTDDVEGVVHIGYPVAHGLIQCVLERFAAGFDRYHGSAQQLHAVDVGALALHVFAAHVDHALQAVAGAYGRRGHAVLAGTGLGNDARLAHALGQHGLADGVVDFVRAGVVQVFALEVNLRATDFAADAGGMVDGRGAAHKVGEFGFEFRDEGGVVLVLGVGRFQFVNRVGQRLGDKTAAVDAEMAPRIGLVVVGHGSVLSRKAVVGGANRGDKLVNFGGVFDALEGSTPWRIGFDPGADVKRQRTAAWA